MHCSGLTGSTVALAIAAAIGLATPAAALPLTGNGGTAEAVESIVQRAAHKHKDWYWHGGWWREGPWADHAIHGVTPTWPWTGANGYRWGADRLAHCAAKYRSFDPRTGTYLSSRGVRRICR